MPSHESCPFVSRRNILQILLVEDNPADVYFLRTALKELGFPYCIEVQEDGRLAWEHLRQLADDSAVLPDLILLDLNLPGMSGRDILTEMVKHPAFRKIPTCVLTGAPSEHSVIEDYPALRLCFEAKTDCLTTLKSIAERILAFAAANPAN